MAGTSCSWKRKCENYRGKQEKHTNHKNTQKAGNREIRKKLIVVFKMIAVQCSLRIKLRA